MHKLLFAKVEFWLVLLLMLVGLLGLVGFGALVLDGTRRDGGRLGAVSTTAVAMAKIPYTIRDLSRADASMAANLPMRFATKPAGWSFAAGDPLPGYLLLSRYDGDRARHVVELVALADGTVLHQWWPDADSLLPEPPADPRLTNINNWNTRRFRAIHPALNGDGELLIKDHYSVLLGLDACARRAWLQDAAYFHHSTEPDGQGGFWSPALMAPQTVDEVPADFFEDALAHVDGAGRLLSQRSLTKVFLDHGLEYLIFAHKKYMQDPLHLNDIQPVLADGPHWKKGDLFLSLRALSIVMLYRPATDEILWMKQGPWMSQHDVDILDDRRIAIFDNHAYDRGHGIRVRGSNQIAVYDFETGEVSYPWNAALTAADVKTPLEGLFTILPNGSLMVEEENFGRLLIFSPDGEVRAEFVNKGADGRAYRMGWSRHLSPDKGDAALARLKGVECAGDDT
ncbi:arylsulfotransferase family protein [Albidovulum aquaemixtae]|nr:arylsulfotransferase family protein [Defluviimonas aquaemixtae]